MIAPPWFRGVWRREWIRYGDGAPFEDRVVRDVQTPSVFGSVRIPIDRPTARGFDDLDDTQLRAMLAQKGFAGVATFDGDVATWHHAIDFQPRGELDTARITQESPSCVLEEGLDDSFAELWWNLAPNDGRYLGVEVLRDERVVELYAVVGDHFVYARDRDRELPDAESLAELGAGASREELIALLDCELSYGRVRGARVPWQIELSTLPWREGAVLDTTSLRSGNVLVNTFTRADHDVIVAAR